MSDDYLRRFTDLTALMYLLHKRKITLLDPASWPDKNDSHYLALYKEKRKLKSVLALCFSQTDERYHHWSVFAPGASGVCIKFKREQLVKAVRKHTHVHMHPVTYLTLDEIRKRTLKIAELPFLKRHAFEHEDEFRIIYTSKTKKLAKLDISVPLSCIEKITLSPWMHSGFSYYVKQTLWAISGCEDLEIVRSTLISNEEWKSLGDDAK
jgi:hypothetical protein